MTTRRVLICLAASDNVGGRFIRWVFKSPVSHAFIIYKSTEWDWWEAVQINQHGVHKVSARKIIKSGAYKSIRAFEPKFDLWIGVLTKRYFIGRDYDFKGVFAGLLKGLLQRFLGIKIHKLIHSGSALFCSEYVAEVIKAAPNAPTLVEPPSELAPHMLLTYCETSSWYKEVDWEKLEHEIRIGI